MGDEPTLSGFASLGELVAALDSRDRAVRERAASLIEAATDPAISEALEAALGNSRAIMVKRALEVLCVRPDLAAVEAIEHLAETRWEFDVVVLARILLDTIRGARQPGQPTGADYRRMYDTGLVFESLVRNERSRGVVPVQHEGDSMVVLMPSFHPELAVELGADRAWLWLRHDSLWQTMSSGGFGATGYRCVLTTDPNEVDQLRTLAARGFVTASDGVQVDGLRFGGYRRVGGDLVALSGQNNQRDLIEFTALARRIGMRNVASFGEYEWLRDLGIYVDAGFEVAECVRPLRAMVLSGRCDEAAWEPFAAAHQGRRFDVVDIMALMFVAPSVAVRVAEWMASTGAIVVTNADNPYTHGLSPDPVADWPAAGERLVDRPTLHIIGHWVSKADPSLPDPSRLIGDATPEDRESVAAALDQGIPYVHYMGLSPCRVCGRQVGSAELTNGTYAWPEGLSHYVRDHGIVLPPALNATTLARPPAGNRWLTALAAEACLRSLDWWREAHGSAEV